MVTLCEVIQSVLSESTDVYIRDLRLLQLLYWISLGGGEEIRFESAAMIYASALFGNRSQLRPRKQLPRKEAALLTIADGSVGQILREIGNNDLFFRLLYVEIGFLKRDDLFTINSTLERLADFCRVFLQLKTEVGDNSSFNDVSRVIGGRTETTKIRKVYKRQMGFVYAMFSSDPGLIDFFVHRRQRTIERPADLLKGLRDRISEKRVLHLLERAKTVISLLDPTLSEYLASAWPELEQIDLNLPPLLAEQRAKLNGRARRPADERRSTPRQKPLML